MHQSNEAPRLGEEAMEPVELDPPSIDNPYAKGFLENLTTKIDTPSLQSKLTRRDNAIEQADNFAGKIVSPGALGLAGYAHLMESFSDDTYRSDLACALKDEFYESKSEIDDAKLYSLGILLDIAEVRLETRDTLAKYADIDEPVLDYKLLTKLANTTNLESIIVSASAHHSEFTELRTSQLSGNDLSEMEEKRLAHLAKTIRSVDSILLELTGFDAFAANALNQVYIWDLEQKDCHQSIEQAKATIQDLGGYPKITEAADDFLRALFNDHVIEEVASSQNEGRLRFSDGVGDISSDKDQLLTRVLSRLKSVGSLAQKIENSDNKDIPADIIGMTLVVDELDEVASVVNAALTNIEASGAKLVSAPSRNELIHIKGSRDFIDSISQNVDLANKTWQPEVDDNGFEAVKITLLHQYNGINYPIEIQITHDEARKNSRHGMASHTLFKLAKLFGTEIPRRQLRKISRSLQGINRRKQRMLENHGQELCLASSNRVEAFLDSNQPAFEVRSALGRTACS